MKNTLSKKYILKRIAADGESVMYFKSRIDKAMFHYVFNKDEAIKLTKEEVKKLVSEVKHKEKFKIMEVKNGK